MTKDFQTWLSQNTNGDPLKLKDLRNTVKAARSKTKGKRQSDLATVDNILNHIETAGVFPHDPALDSIDFSQLV